MSPFARLLDPLRQAAAAFFKHDVTLRREDDGVRIVLEERDPGGVPKPRPPSRAELVARKEKQDLELMREQLAALLDDLTGARQTMRHLVFVEQALAKKGLKALHKLPLDVLQRALDQLEGLVTNWSPAGLASLRSKMAVAIIDREHMDPEGEIDAYRTAAVLDAPPVAAPRSARGAGDAGEAGVDLALVDAVAVSEVSDDDNALAAAYAALGNLAPSGVETQFELGSPSARAVSRDATRPLARQGSADVDINLRELHT